MTLCDLQWPLRSILSISLLCSHSTRQSFEKIIFKTNTKYLTKSRFLIIKVTLCDLTFNYLRGLTLSIKENPCCCYSCSGKGTRRERDYYSKNLSKLNISLYTCYDMLKSLEHEKLWRYILNYKSLNFLDCFEVRSSVTPI